MPSDDQTKEKDTTDKMKSSHAKLKSSSPSQMSDYFDNHDAGSLHSIKHAKNHKHLFTVKPGGIAGYLGILIFTSFRGTEY
jgi:hypothetical protein